MVHRSRIGGSRLTVEPCEYYTKIDAKESEAHNFEPRSVAHTKGEQLLAAWLEKRKEAVERICGLFDASGNPVTSDVFPEGRLHATAFSDLYKWTMLPVMRKLETLKGDNITVSFGIDLRDAKMRDALREGKGPGGEFENTPNPLEQMIQTALETKLAPRTFNIDLFSSVLVGPRANIFDFDGQTKAGIIKAVCGTPGSERTLVDTVTPYGVKYRPDAEDIANKKVTVSFYYDPEAYYTNDEQGVHFIEATGPWHRVTWLETSMMQCVYETKLKYDLEAAKRTYSQWLYGALLRCAKSVAYTIDVQKAATAGWSGPAGVPPPMSPALFTGRRTGGMAFLLLQNLFFADHFVPLTPAAPMPGVNAEGKTYSLGTSSCDSAYILKKNLQLDCLPTAGTHAHELSMVTSILFPHLDDPKQGGYPATTQLIGHYLYGKYVWLKSGRAGPLPMLPDTLGTRVFLKAATRYVVPNLMTNSQEKVPFLDLVRSARQDSGKLSDFMQNMTDAGYKFGKMASEIDDSDTLQAASKLKFASFGAGGFFGDSEKVWGNKSASSNSMAVKAVRVLYPRDTTDITGISYMEPKIIGGKPFLQGYPVKIGDPKDGQSPKLTAKDKLSLNKNKESEFIENVKSWASNIRESAGKPGEPIVATEKVELSAVFDENKPEGVPTKGGKGGKGLTRRSKSKSKSKSKSRRSTRRN